MKIGKGVVNNFNKKLFTGIFTITFLAAPLTGCASIKDIKYIKSEKGYVQGIDGTVSFKILQNCEIYKIKNNITGEVYYTILAMQHDFAAICNYDIFTSKEILDENYEQICIANLGTYLQKIDFKKSEYTEEELVKILEIVKDIESSREQNKKLVKEK